MAESLPVAVEDIGPARAPIARHLSSRGWKQPEGIAPQCWLIGETILPWDKAVEFQGKIEAEVGARVLKIYKHFLRSSEFWIAVSFGLTLLGGAAGLMVVKTDALPAPYSGMAAIVLTGLVSRIPGWYAKARAKAKALADAEVQGAAGQIAP